MQLRVLSTEGFLDAGRIIVDGEQRACTSKSREAFELTEPLPRDFGSLEYVNDASILGGDSFEPGAGRMDLLRVGTCVDGARSGPVQPVIEHITVEGFTLDGSYHSQVQERAGKHPCGIWIGGQPMSRSKT
jgi:hypothetical protein